MGQYIDFKQIAESVDVADVAQHLGLKLKQSGKELRCACPACDADDPRSLAIYPETASFRCYAAAKSGDSIALYAHIQNVGQYAAAKALQSQFGASAPTQPQKPERRTEKSQPSPFDPEQFASKLAYTDEVASLGINEKDATRLGIGFHPQRKRVYFPIRNPDGSYAGFITCEGVKLPPKWVASNVVPLKRRA